MAPAGSRGATSARTVQADPQLTTLGEAGQPGVLVAVSV